MSTRASLIISVYNNTSFLRVVLDSLKFQTEQNFEIIISEDACHEEMKHFIESYPFENEYQHLSQDDNGWQKNKALNNAIKAAKSDWLIFIDGDCVLHPRFIEMHLRYAQEDTILAGKRVKLDEKTSNFLQADISRNIFQMQKILLGKIFFGKGDIRFLEDSIFISPDGLLGVIPKMRRANRLIGSNMSFSKKSIYSINGFDEEFRLPAVGEDTDLAWRFKAVGLRLKSVRNLAIQYHLYHKECWSDKSENFARMLENRKQNRFYCIKGLNTVGPV